MAADVGGYTLVGETDGDWLFLDEEELSVRLREREMNHYIVDRSADKGSPYLSISIPPDKRLLDFHQFTEIF